MSVSSDCLFCDIVAGVVAGHVVLETEDMVGFLDIRPVFKGHTLLVPRRHVMTLPDLPADLRDPSSASVSALPRRWWTDWVRRARSWR